MSTIVVPELERAPAEEVVAFAVRRVPAGRTLGGGLQKEAVLFHMLSEIQAAAGTSDGGRERVPPPIRAFTIDTGVLFAETLAVWKQFEERFPIGIDVIDASSPGAPWTVNNCCSAAKVQALEHALTDVDAWITGIRREQAGTRAHTPKLERDERRGIWKLNPLADWSEKQIWTYIFKHDLPYNLLHDQGYDSIGCAPCTLPGAGRDGRWSGQDKTECGIHIQ